MEHAPVFIIGAPRSGTTYLASMLEHTKYGAPFETHFITKYYKKLDLYGDLNLFDNFSHLVCDILKERPVMQWRLDIDIEEMHRNLKPNILYKDIVNEICMYSAQKNNKEYWGDKTPHYIKDIDIINNLFPKSKYLFLIRDGRDVAVSLLKKPWGPNNIYACAEYWNTLYKKEDIINELEGKRQLIKIRYEDLLDNVTDNAEQIYQFLGSQLSEQQKEKMLGSVMRGNYGKWKSELTESQIKVFESIAGERLKKFGYEVTSEIQQLSVVKQTLYRAHNKIMLLKHLFVINIIDGIRIKFFGKQPFAE